VPADASHVTRRRYGAALERALLGAAWEELRESGYAGFTIDAVARRAGTSRPVLYRRWPNRAQLVLAGERDLLGGWRDQVRHDPDPDGGAAHRAWLCVRQPGHGMAADGGQTPGRSPRSCRPSPPTGSRRPGVQIMQTRLTKAVLCSRDRPDDAAHAAGQRGH
jgi:AcrR family transcriptional regulator